SCNPLLRIEPSRSGRYHAAVPPGKTKQSPVLGSERTAGKEMNEEGASPIALTLPHVAEELKSTALMCACEPSLKMPKGSSTVLFFRTTFRFFALIEANFDGSPMYSCSST